MTTKIFQLYKKYFNLNWKTIDSIYPRLDKVYYLSSQKIINASYSYSYWDFLHMYIQNEKLDSTYYLLFLFLNDSMLVKLNKKWTFLRISAWPTHSGKLTKVIADFMMIYRSLFEVLIFIIIGIYKNNRDDIIKKTRTRRDSKYVNLLQANAI